MDEMDKLAIAAGLQEMSAEDRALFKETAGEIVDILEEQFRDNKGVVMNRTEEINLDGVKTTLGQAGDVIKGLAGDFAPGDELFGNPGALDFKGLRPRGMDAQRLVADDATFTQHVREGGPLSENLEFTVVDESNIDKILKIDHPETYEDDPIPPGRPTVTHVIDADVAKAIDATGADAIGIQHRPWPEGAERSGENDELYRKVGTIASSKNSAALMMHLATQGRQPGRNVSLEHAIQSQILSPLELGNGRAPLDREYHPAVEHIITSAKTKWHLNAAAGWSMLNPSAHQFLSVKFYGDDTEHVVENASHGRNGALLFTLSGDRVINVGQIDRHNTTLLLQNAKVREIRVKSSRRY